MDPCPHGPELTSRPLPRTRGVGMPEGRIEVERRTPPRFHTIHYAGVLAAPSPMARTRHPAFALDCRGCRAREGLGRRGGALPKTRVSQVRRPLNRLCTCPPCRNRRYDRPRPAPRSGEWAAMGGEWASEPRSNRLRSDPDFGARTSHGAGHRDGASCFRWALEG